MQEILKKLVSIVMKQADKLIEVFIESLLNNLTTPLRQQMGLWEQPELTSELESDLQHDVDWGRKWLVDFNAGKTLFDQSNSTGAIDVKMDGPVLEEKSSCKVLALTFSSKLD